MRRAKWLVAVAIACLLPCTAAATSKHAVTAGCWRQNAAFPFPFPSNPPLSFSQPSCRTAAHGSQDGSVRAGLTAYSGAFKNLLRGADPTNPASYFKLLLRPHGGARKWPIVDSLGRTFGWVQQDRSAEGDVWTVYRANGRTVLGFTGSSRTQLLIQGRACMASQALEKRYAMVVLFGADFGYGPLAFGTGPGPGPVYLGIRGFIPRNALPPRGLADPDLPFRGKTTNAIIDRFDTGCTPSDLGLRAASRPEAKLPLNPIFDWQLLYQGQQRIGGLISLGSPANATVPGNRYANYHGWPDPNQYGFAYGDAPQPPPVPPAPHIVQEIKVMANTTAVAAGGIVRAILPVGLERGGGYQQLDHFDYHDPNVACVTFPGTSTMFDAWVAQWALIRFRGAAKGIEGWVPVQSAPTIVTCSAPDGTQPEPGS